MRGVLSPAPEASPLHHRFVQLVSSFLLGSELRRVGSVPPKGPLPEAEGATQQGAAIKEVGLLVLGPPAVDQVAPVEEMTTQQQGFPRGQQAHPVL